jgi:hypothetical protein
MGVFGLIVSAFSSSFAFLLFSLPNFGLAAFFGYKYFVYNKTIQKYEQRKRRGKKF